MDLAAYGLGQTDSFQGTGVFSSIKFEREPAADKPEETTPAKEKEAKTTTTDQK
jgi:hypothetical protein